MSIPVFLPCLHMIEYQHSQSVEATMKQVPSKDKVNIQPEYLYVKYDRYLTLLAEKEQLREAVREALEQVYKDEDKGEP